MISSTFCPSILCLSFGAISSRTPSSAVSCQITEPGVCLSPAAGVNCPELAAIAKYPLQNGVVSVRSFSGKKRNCNTIEQQALMCKNNGELHLSLEIRAGVRAQDLGFGNFSRFSNIRAVKCMLILIICVFCGTDSFDDFLFSSQPLIVSESGVLIHGFAAKAKRAFQPIANVRCRLVCCLFLAGRRA